MIKFFFCLTLLSLGFPALAAKIDEGSWRFELKTTYAAVPFVIDFKYKGKKLTGTLRNGKEDIPLTNITVKGETIIIPLQLYEHGLELRIQSKEAMAGDLVRYNKNPKVTTPVVGKKGPSERYPGPHHKPEVDLTGKWAVKLKQDDGKDYEGVVIFEQDKGRIDGSILSPTGDYRYFSGYVAGDTFEAASFDGVYNYVFKGKVVKDKIEGSIFANWMTKVEGKRDEFAALPDPTKHTQVEKLSFKFPDLKGKKVSLTDARFKDKPVIVSIYGSWCPNCVDEMNYLIPWYKENAKRGIEIVALAFERSLTKADAKKQLKKVDRKMKFPFPLLLAGYTSQEKPENLLPGIKNFISFPTTIFLNKKHEVVKVHAGFTGPSTGKFYEQWKREFNATVDELLK